MTVYMFQRKMQTSAQVLYMSTRDETVLVSINGKQTPTYEFSKGFKVPTTFLRAYSPSGHSDLNTAQVKFLEESEALPDGFFQNLPIGTSEFFATQANLR